MNFADILSLLRTMGMELRIANDIFLDAMKFELHYKHGPYCRNGIMQSRILTEPDAEEHICQFVMNMIKELDEYAGISRAQEILDKKET